MKFFDEVQGDFGVTLAIPSNCALNIGNRALVVLNTPSVHSPWPNARGEVPLKSKLGIARFQVFDSASDFLVPGLLNQLIRTFETL